MAPIEKRLRNGKVSYRARYRDPSGRHRVKTFRRKVDGEKYLALIEAAKLRGTWTDPAHPGRVAGDLVGERQRPATLDQGTGSCLSQLPGAHALAPPRWPQSGNPTSKPGSPS
jgi:hypothetical protein